MNLFSHKQIDNGHFHAWCLYEPVSWKHFPYLIASILASRLANTKSTTTHLPLELQHSVYTNKRLAEKLLKFGNSLATLFRVKLYWENAPLLNYATWDLKYGQTEWELVPYNIPLCLDTGHAMLGAKSPDEARKEILTIIAKRGEQIKHLHIHENDLLHDLHTYPTDILTDKLINEITKGKTYIFEK